MNLSPEIVAELFRQCAFISALIAGFSFAFLAVILTNHTTKKIDDWTAGFAIAATAGLIVCALGWTGRTPCVGVVLEQSREHAFSIAREVCRYSSLIVNDVHCVFFFLLNKFRTLRLDSFPQARCGIIDHYNNCSNVCSLDLAVFYQVGICRLPVRLVFAGAAVRSPA